MNYPLISVITPAYNGADYLAEAIESVLKQTYPHFEMIVINDASPDHTDEVMKRFNDPRIKYIVLPQNQGSDAARRVGLDASIGEVIAFLDQDDLFHPDRLQRHIALFMKRPDIGATYNSRFDLNHSSTSIRDIWQAPAVVTLADLVLGFPFSPSDVMLRREWAFRDEIWDDSFVHVGDEIITNGGEIVIYGRLYLAGCRFANVGRALNYRRYHAQRVLSDLPHRCRSELMCQDIMFNDPRLPTDLQKIRNQAYMNTYLIWAYFAFAQNETLLGKEWLGEAIRLCPHLLQDEPCGLVDFMINRSIEDESRSHVELLELMFANLPDEAAVISKYQHWAVDRGYVLKGVRSFIWGRLEEGRRYLTQVERRHSQVDESFIQKLTFQLLNYERELGSDAANDALQRLLDNLDSLFSHSELRRIKGCYFVNRAFQKQRAGEHDQIVGNTLRAIVNNPKYLSNRGVLSLLARFVASIPFGSRTYTP